jgi:hypothetical protein
MPGKRAWQSEGQKGHIPKRRQVCKWQPNEEEALRKAVKEYEFLISILTLKCGFLLFTCLILPILLRSRQLNSLFL